MRNGNKIHEKKKKKKKNNIKIERERGREIRQSNETSLFLIILNQGNFLKLILNFCVTWWIFIWN